MKEYVCSRFPFLKIGSGPDQARFENGRLITGNPKTIEFVENSDWFGVYIFEVGGEGVVVDYYAEPEPEIGNAEVLKIVEESGIGK